MVLFSSRREEESSFGRGECGEKILGVWKMLEWVANGEGSLRKRHVMLVRQ